LFREHFSFINETSSASNRFGDIAINALKNNKLIIYFLSYGYGSAKMLTSVKILTELECYVYIDHSTELQ